MTLDVVITSLHPGHGDVSAELMVLSPRVLLPLVIGDDELVVAIVFVGGIGDGAYVARALVGIDGGTVFVARA